jgi:hypothetical protein
VTPIVKGTDDTERACRTADRMVPPPPSGSCCWYAIVRRQPAVREQRLFRRRPPADAPKSIGLAAVVELVLCALR